MNSWTRLPRTNPNLWNHFRDHMIKQENDLGLKYHTFDHVISIYQYLHHINFPYSEPLDIAVLVHDSVFDSKKFKEYRSSLMYFQYLKNLPGAVMYLDDYERHDYVHHIVMSTDGHSLLEINNRIASIYPTNISIQIELNSLCSAMICGDLHQLANPITTIRNYSLILEESINLYGIDEVAFAKANISYMSKLSQNVMNNMYRNKEHGHFFKNVSDGIDLTIAMSEDIEGIYS